MSIRSYWNALYAEIKLELVSSFRYRFSIISDILVFAVLMGFFVLGNTGQALGTKYAYENYKELFLVGYIAWSLALAGLSASNSSISTELSRGTFYRKLNSKCSLPILLFGELISSMLIHMVVIGVLCGISILAWNIRFHISLVLVLSLIISTIGMFGIGLLIAGFTIRYKKVSSLILLFQLGLLFVTDTIPTSSVVLGITRFIPLTACNEVIRTYIVSKTLDYKFVVLVIVSISWIMIGNFVLKHHINKAKKDGTLLFY